MFLPKDPPTEVHEFEAPAAMLTIYFVPEADPEKIEGYMLGLQQAAAKVAGVIHAQYGVGEAKIQRPPDRYLS